MCMICMLLKGICGCGLSDRMRRVQTDYDGTELNVLIFGHSIGTAYVRDLPGEGGIPNTVLQYSPSGKVFVPRDLNSPFLSEMYSPTQSDKTRYSISWLYLGEDWVREHNLKRINFLNISKSGTGYAQWIDPARYNPSYQAVLQTYKPQFIFLFLGDGEARFSVGNSQNYYDAIKLLVNQAKAVVPDVKFVMAEEAGLQWSPESTQMVRDAQKKLIDDGVVLQGGDMDALRAQLPADDVDFDRSHFVNGGFSQQAAWWKNRLQLLGLY